MLNHAIIILQTFDECNFYDTVHISLRGRHRAWLAADAIFCCLGDFYKWIWNLTKLALPQQFHETYLSKVYSNCLHISFLPFLFNLFSHSLSIMNKSQSLRQQAAQTIFVLPTFQWWYLALIDVVWRLILYRCWWLVFSNLPEEWCIINNIWLWHSYMMVSCIHTVWPQYGNKKFVWFFLFGFFFAKCM